MSNQTDRPPGKHAPISQTASTSDVEVSRFIMRAALDEQRQALWLRQVLDHFVGKPRGWRGWLPQWLWRRGIVRRLKRRNIFDAEGYANRYPEIAQARLDPLVHFVRHGLDEKRDCGLQPNPAVSRIPGADDVAAVLASGMFDASWYRACHGIAGEETDLLRDYLATSAIDPLRDPGPLFCGATYQLGNHDLHGMHPLVHYVHIGRREGRLGWTAARARRFIASAQGEPLYPLRELIARDRPVAVLYWQQGNFFFADIAHYIAQVLNAAGYHACVAVDHAGLSLAQMEVLVVAPHEYCVHGPGRNFPPDVAARAVHVNTEQWHTQWFSLALEHITTSRRALDINPASARGLARLGIQSGFLPLLPIAGGVFDFSNRTASDDLARLRSVKQPDCENFGENRTYDVMFVGILNQRRAHALAQLAPCLAEFDCFIHAPRFDGPVTPDNPNTISSHDLAQIARHSRILLNIHQGDSDYFEWHRLVLTGIAQGCVPLTEPCIGIGVVVESEHYIATSLDTMSAKLDWLLKTTDGARELERLRSNGLALLTQLGAHLTEQLR